MEIVINIVIILLIIGAALGMAYIVNKTRNRLYSDKMSFREIMDLCELPIVTFTNNGRKFNFLLDTGASKSIINKTVLEELNYQSINKVGDVYGVDGKKQVVSFIVASLGYKNKYYDEEFQVLDMSTSFGNLKSDFGVNLHGILSSTFFRRYRYILNFDELIAYSKR